MLLVQIFLPISDNEGNRFHKDTFDDIQKALTYRFGGITAFSQNLADGLWKEEGSVQKDQIMMVEVMVEELEVTWWSQFRKHLEDLLRQDSILIRSIEVSTL